MSAFSMHHYFWYWKLIKIPCLGCNELLPKVMLNLYWTLTVSICKTLHMSYTMNCQ